MAGEEKYGTKAIIALLADIKNKISDIEENVVNKEDFKELTDKVTALEEQLDTKEDAFSPGEGLEMTEDRILNITLDLEIFWVNSTVPDTPPVGKSNKILLVPNASSTDEGNYYTEYIWVVDTEHPDGHYEELGTYKSDVDLSIYQTKTDNNLQTTDKTIVGAINEILPKATGVGKIYPNSNETGEIFNAYEGNNANIASGEYSHAEGYNNEASGHSSHAEGSNTVAFKHYSHTEGSHTQAFSFCEHAEGKFNKSYISTDGYIIVHSVGIGTSEANRKNAHEIRFNGDHYVYGVGGFNGTNSDTAQTLQNVLANLAPNIIEVPELTADYIIPANATTREYIYEISIGTTKYNVTAAEGIKWIDNNLPLVEANSKLIVSIVNNIAVWGIVYE